MGEVVVNGVRLVYETRGEGPPVLMVCGTGQPAESWWMFGGPALLDAGYQVTVFDNRGMPPSEVPPPPYSVSEMADDAIGLLEHLGAAPMVVMGASLGGMITQTVALRRPDLVKAAIFLVGCGNVSKYAEAAMSAHLKSIQAGVELTDRERAAFMVQAMAPSSSWGDDAAFEALVAMASMFDFADRNGELGQYMADVQWAAEDHIEELADLHVPALAIAGEYDWSFPPRLVRQAVDQMPDGEFVEIKGATHLSLDKIDEINVTVVDFVQRRVGLASSAR